MGGDSRRRRWWHGRLTYANVVATLALFIALGGVSYAAVKLKANSVGSREIKKDSVRSGDIATGAIKSGELGNGSVGASKIQGAAVGEGALGPDAVSTSKIAPGAVGDSDIATGAVGSGSIADGSVGKADLAPNETPHSPTFEICDGAGGHPWAKAGQDLDPRYWLDNDGVVHLEGALTCAGTPGNGVTIFSMPAAYRPAQDVVRFGVLGAGNTQAQVAVVVNPFDSALVFDGGTAVNSDNYISLEGITYRARTQP